MSQHLGSASLATMAERLLAARDAGAAIPPVRHQLPPGDVAAAYAIQQRTIAAMVARGHRRVGRKIGLTSVAVQKQLGVDQPDFGVLLDSMDLGGPGAETPVSRFIAPRIEAEFAVRLGADITTRGGGPAAISAAVECVAPAFEIVDSAIASWDIGIVDTIADNASCGAFVVGVWQPFTTTLDLPGRRMTMRRGAEVVSSGAGSASLGDPLNAVAWLADACLEAGDPLRAGEVILSGALGPMTPMTAGEYSVEIEGFPSLCMRATS